MPRVNYREAIELFGHTDAEFVGFRFGSSDEEDYYQVRFCPWWLNSLYIEDPNQDDEAGEQLVTLYPIDLTGFQLDSGWGSYNWEILNDHPFLRKDANGAGVMINQSISFEEVLDILEDAQSRLTGHWKRIDVLEHVPLFKMRRWVGKGPFQLGHFPHPVYTVVLDVLNEHNVETYPPYNKYPKQPMRLNDNATPLICLLDGGNYIIARDFEIEANVIRKDP